MLTIYKIMIMLAGAASVVFAFIALPFWAAILWAITVNTARIMYEGHQE